MTLDLEPQELIDLFFAVRRNLDEGNRALAELLRSHVKDVLGEYVQIPLTKGYYATINRADFDLVARFNWFVMEAKEGCIYAGTRIRDAAGKQTTLRMHRLIMACDDDDVMVDYKDHNGLINTRENLRLASRVQNRRNSRKALGKSSRFIGVSIDWTRALTGRSGLWQSSISMIGEDGLRKTWKLGHFATEEEAALAYNTKASELFGEWASLNALAA